MTYRKKTNLASTTRSVFSQNLPIKPSRQSLKLNNGTEVFEVRETFSVNSLIDITFERAKPIRSRHQELFNRLDESIHHERIDIQSSKLNYIGCTLIPSDNTFTQMKHSPMKDINIGDEHYNNIYFQNMKERIELPLERHQRLIQELNTFQSDLELYLNEEQQEMDQKSENVQKDEQNIKILLSEIQKMKSNLEDIQQTNEYKYILDPNYTRFSDINRSLMKSMMNMSNVEYGQRLKDNKLLSGLKEIKEEKHEKNGNNGQWNIYQNQKNIKTRGTSDAQFLDIEDRISAVENSIGFVSDMKNPFPDLLTAIGYLEGKYEYTFLMNWKTVKMQSERVASDLKNIKYHLDLLQARYKPNEKKTRLSWEKLEDLSRMMFKWDPMVFELILIVQRLQSMQNYHYRSCLFINRVNDVYKQQCLIYESLKADEVTLGKCLESLQKNKKVMKQNCTYIKQRVKRLEARCK